MKIWEGVLEASLRREARTDEQQFHAKKKQIFSACSFFFFFFIFGGLEKAYDRLAGEELWYLTKE